jgi:transaldolase
VYDETGGADGFVSIEVSPHLAHDIAGTVDEAKRLRAEVARPNVMIKVPATPEGIPAIEALVADGVNINITLMFSMKHYEAVARAYVRVSCPTILEHDLPADKLELMAVVVQIHRSRCAVAQAHMEPLVIVKLSIALYLFDQLGPIAG